MLNKTQKIAISRNFIISLLFFCLIFAAFGLNLDDAYAADLNGDGNGLAMELNVEDKLENSQTDKILEVDKGSGNVMASEHTVQGQTFQDIQNAIDGAEEGDKIILVGEYHSNGYESTVNIDRRLTITSTSQATLDGDGLSGIFEIQSSARGTVISNLKFVHGEKWMGSALNIGAKDVTIDNCLFENNHCCHGGAVTSTYDMEGAENATVINCNFTNNTGYLENLTYFSNAGALGLYGLNSKLINCIFDSNWIASEDICYGGALQIGIDDDNYKALVYKCTFINNRAINSAGNSHGGAGCVRNGVEYIDCLFINNSAGQGGALTFHASGKLQNCTFINNTASLYGGAVSTGYQYEDMQLEIIDCYFEGNDAPKGGAIQAAGLNIDIMDSNFTENHADEYGGALNIVAVNVGIFDSSFNSNIAEIDGGAIYTKGSDTVVNRSSFISNEAIPDYSRLDDGLGGAIYINSTKANVANSDFYYNKARNGSAIYYDKYGNGLVLTNNTLFENQAWVYLLPIQAHDIYYGETEQLKSVIHGGNNIAKYNNLAVSNAIYNAADYSKLSIDGESPVRGATNNGRLYQDDREYNMKIQLTVKKDDGSVVLNQILNSNYLGAVSKKLNNLQPGKYYVTAKHIEDTYYKAITNTTTFNVIPKTDSQVRKVSSSESYNFDDVVVWTLNITNNGPNKATNVTVNDVLPNGLIYIGDDTNNKYDSETGVLRIGDLDVGQTVIVNIYARINKTGEIVNNANVTSKEYDIDLSNNHDEASINVPLTCDLEVKKSVNNSNPNYGDLIKWTIVVRNNGPDAAHNVKVTDILPASMIDVTSDGNYNPETGIWNIGTLGLNKEVTLNIFCRVNATGSIQNNVSVKGKEVDRNMSNNNDSEVVNVNASSDLAIEKSINISSANYTDEITWTLVISNNGPCNATGVKVTDVLPDGLVYVDSVLERGRYSNGVISVGNLAVGETLTFKIISRANKTGTITNVASVKGKEYDQDPSNNRDDASVTIKPAADVEVIKEANVSSPNYGENVTWTITVRNNGPSTAYNVAARDLIPRSLIWQWDDSNGTYNLATGKWTIGRLLVNESVQLHIITLVNDTGAVRNDVSVSCREFDYNKSNNNDSEIIGVNASSDLSIEKSINVSSANFTDEIVWTLVISNDGPCNATGVKVTDVLPDGLIYVDSVLERGRYSNGVISVGNLAVGETLTFKIISRVNKTGTITNVASVKGKEHDPDLSNNRDDASISIKPAADVEVVKEANVSSPHYGENVTWTITVRNNGPSTAYNVVARDLIPESLIWQEDDSNGTYDLATGKWTIGRLLANESVQLNIVTLVNATGTIRNDVSVSCREFDYNKSNNNDSEIIDVNASSDLSIEKSINVSSANFTDEIVWTLVISNDGPCNATGVKVTDVLPDGLVYVDSILERGTYSNGVINVGRLAVGETLTFKIITRVNKTGEIINVASVKGKEYDYDLSNNKDNASVSIKPAADVDVVKDVNVSNPKYGENVTWTITVRNNGPSTAYNVVARDLIPSSLIWQWDDGNGTYDYVTGKWTIGRLLVNESVQLNIATLVNATGTIRNDVSVTCREFDYNKSNNKDSEIIKVNATSDLAIEKSINISSANYTDEITWTLVISNNGPDNATGVKITDVLPDGLVYVDSVLDRGTYSNGVINVGRLAVGETLTFRIICKVNRTGDITNVASVRGKEDDPDLSNNMDNASVSIKPAADVEVTKEANVSNPKYGENVTWTITVRNNGPSTAYNVAVRDPISKSLIWQWDDGNGTYDHVTGKWTIGRLLVNESVQLNIITIVNATGIVQNNVSVSCREFDHNKSNNKDNASVNVSRTADVGVVKLVNNSSPEYHNIIKWTIIAKNNGPDKATSVFVEDILPDGLILEDANASKGFYDDGIWSLCCLENGEEQYLELICIVNKTGKITNLASITADEVDLNESNNRDNKTIEVPSAADLEVIKMVNNTNPNYLDLIRWTIVVSNNGPDNATGVFVRDIMPEGLEIVESSENIDEYGNWHVGDLEVNGARELEIICRVNSTGTFRNIASVSGGQSDPYPDNNEDDEYIDVAPACDLSITKTVSKYYYQVGDAIDYSIRIANRGPDEAKNVNVNEILDSSLVLRSFSASKGNYDDENQIWQIDTLDNGEYAELHIRAMAAGPGIVSNMVYATSDTPDYNLDNNNASVDVNVSEEEISNKSDDNITQNNDLAEINSYLSKMQETGNPFIVLLISVVFSLMFLGRNFSKKR